MLADLSGLFTHTNGYPSAAGPVQISESSPVRDGRSTTEPPNQLIEVLIKFLFSYIFFNFVEF